MPSLPPVHTHIPLRSFSAAAASIVRPREVSQKAEHVLSEAYPNHQCFLTSSGTSALTAALCASIGGKTQGTVALPAYACPDIATAAIGAGFKILLYDINPRTLAPDEHSVLQALRSGATHVLVAHWFGRIIDPAPIEALADAFGAIVIEDAAQHAGGSLADQRAGGLTKWGVLSFGRGKGLNAGGGGALLVHRSLAVPEQATVWPRPDVISSLRTLFAAFGTTLLSRPPLFGVVRQVPFLQIGETHFHEPHAVSDISPVSAVLLGIALEREASELEARRVRDAQYQTLLRTTVGVHSIAPCAGTATGALRHPFLASATVMEAVTSLSGRGVVRGYPRLLTQYRQIQPALATHDGHFPGASELVTSLCTAPTHRLVRNTQIESIVTTLGASTVR